MGPNEYSISLKYYDKLLLSKILILTGNIELDKGQGHLAGALLAQVRGVWPNPSILRVGFSNISILDTKYRLNFGNFLA